MIAHSVLTKEININYVYEVLSRTEDFVMVRYYVSDQKLDNEKEIETKAQQVYILKQFHWSSQMVTYEIIPEWRDYVKGFYNSERLVELNRLSKFQTIVGMISKNLYLFGCNL